MKQMIRDDFKSSDEDYDHFLNHNVEILFNYVNQYFLLEKSFIVCVTPRIFDYTDPVLGSLLIFFIFRLDDGFSRF